MAKRFTDTDLWDKQWYMALSCKLKCLVRFLYDKCDLAGVWSPNWALASLYVGEQVTADDLEPIAGELQHMPNGKIFIRKFISFQYGILSYNCLPHRKVMSMLREHGLYEQVISGSGQIAGADGSGSEQVAGTASREQTAEGSGQMAEIVAGGRGSGQYAETGETAISDTATHSPLPTLSDTAPRSPLPTLSNNALHSSLPALSDDAPPPPLPAVQQALYSEADYAGYKKFNTWIEEITPRVAQMQEPFTIEQFLHIRDYYNPDSVRDMLKTMHNYVPLLTKNISAYVTLSKWLRKEERENSR